MSKLDSPKELIAIAKISKWESIKSFLRKLIKKTLKKNIGYEVVIINKTNKSSGKNELNFSIKQIDQIEKLDKISDFNHISFYQSNGYINNHISLTQNEEVLVMLAKYMGPEINHVGNFDFSIYLNSLDNPYFTISEEDKRLNCKDLLKIFHTGILEFKKPDLTNIQESELEKFIFEKISGKNAIWGKSETKHYKKWKKKCSILFRSELNKNPYYRGSITKKYKEFMTKMFDLWYSIANKLKNPSSSSEIRELQKFLNTF